jgi:ribosomal protein S18 acetylase RimI-like enzyme
MSVRRLRSIRRRMSFAAFDRLPRQLGWRHEYHSGVADIRPASIMVPFELALDPRPHDAKPEIRAVSPDDRRTLRRGFLDAFRSAPEYACRTLDGYRRAGDEYLDRFFGAECGDPSPASVLATTDGKLVGAALITAGPTEPVLDCLFVCPAFARAGWATALVSHAAVRLHRSGETWLRSYAMQASEPSLRWHERFGFRELPDIYVARHRFRFYRDEWDRHHRRDDLPEDELTELGKAMDYWHRESDRLDEDRFQEYLKNKTGAELTR